MMIVRSPPGRLVRISGTRNAPMNAIPKIMTGNMENEKLPNMVEWTRHSSFIIATKSSNMAILPDKREEVRGQVLASRGKFGNGPCVEQLSLVEDRKVRADLFGDFEDVGRDEDSPSVLHIRGKIFLDNVLHDGI